MIFPQTVHQIWLGKNPFPATSERWRDSIGRYLPEWSYRLWTEADVPELAPDALCPQLMLAEAAGMGIRADVMRFEILRQHGGLYLDHDMELLRPLDEIMVSGCLHFGFDPFGNGSLGCAILASPQGHAFLDFHLGRIGAKVRPAMPDDPWDVLGLTGPYALGASVNAWLRSNVEGYPIQSGSLLAGWIFDHADLVGWSKEAVYPYAYTDLAPDKFRAEHFPAAYAAHHWQGEWLQVDADEKYHLPHRKK